MEKSVSKTSDTLSEPNSTQSRIVEYKINILLSDCITFFCDSYIGADSQWRAEVGLNDNLPLTTMGNVIRSLRSFLKYWYFRYTLVTELYMVEEWERNFINIFLLALFCFFFLFNYRVLLPVTQYILGN